MRDIKFRAWVADKGQMEEMTSISLPWVDNPPNFILMQFTGKKDDFGKDIYEGDILEALEYDLSSGSDKDYYVVKFNDNNYGQVLGWNAEDKNGEAHCEYYGQWIAFCKVIGNIYENPNLL